MLAALRRGRALWPLGPHAILAVSPPGDEAVAAGGLERAAAITSAQATPGPSPARALTYLAGGRLRRVELAPAGPRRLWERRPGAEAVLLCRAGGAALLRDGASLVAVRLATGEEKWRLELPCDLGGPVASLPGGDLLVAFADDSWLRLRAVSGKRIDGGGPRDRALAGLRASATALPDPTGPVDYAVDRARIGHDGDVVVVREPGQPELRIEPDGTLVAIGPAGRHRLGRL